MDGEQIIFLVEDREQIPSWLIAFIIIIIIVMIVGAKALSESLEEEPAFCKVLPWPLRIGCDLVWSFWSSILGV